MARYDFRCGRCGVFEIAYAMGAAPARADCPGCQEPSPRVWSAAAVLPGRTALGRAMDADRRSAHEPAVAAAPPQRHGTRPRNPSQAALRARLPRP